MSALGGIVSGALFAGYALAGLFFLRFWKESRDRLFAMFAMAFWLLASQRLAIAMTNSWLEDQWMFYLLRLAAFLVIIVAIVDKNRR